MEAIKQSEQMCKDALDHLLLKDDIITDLKNRLQIEQNENSDLRKLNNDLEIKLHQIEEQFDNSENLKNKTILFNQTPTNKNDNFNLFGSTGMNYINNSQEVIKIIEDKNDLKIKYESLENEFNNYKERNKNLLEIEDIYKTQLDSLKRKNEFLEKQQSQFRDRENYIEELINRYSNLEKDYEQILSNKEIELNEIKKETQIISLENQRFKNQLENLTKNSNNFTQDLVKEIRGLDEKNKELEMNLFKAEIVYKEEIKILQKLINENNLNNNEGNNNSKNKSLKVEDLTTSLTHSIRERIESQNKKISTQNVEIVSLQYELEKTLSELKYEKEFNEKLQKTLAEQKFKITNIKRVNCEVEEAQVQTIMKMDDIDTNKIKYKNLEENLEKMSDSNEKSEKVIKNLKDNNNKLIKVIKERDEEIFILIKKLEKINKGEKLIDKEVFNSISNFSKLNMTISALKMREGELMERIQSYEGSNNNYNKENININNNNLQTVSFNISDESNNNNTANFYKQNNLITKEKDILSEKYELELKGLKEDNYFLREQNFKFISDLNRLNDSVNNYKRHLDSIQQEKDDIDFNHKELINHYENIIKNLQEESEKLKKVNNENIEEMRIKLNKLNETNNSMNDQFTSLQNKFYVQNQMITDKNLEFNDINKKLENEIVINQEIQNLNQNLKENLNKKENENIIIKKENEKFKKDLNDLKISLNEINQKYHFTLNEVDERNKILNYESNQLKENNNKLKLKLNEMYEESKEKENKLINLLKEENKDLENRMRNEMKELRLENENIMKERSSLRLINNELKYENGVLKEQNNNKVNKNNLSFNNSMEKINLSTSNNNIRNSSNINNINNRLQNNYNHIENENKLLKEENLKLRKELEEISNNFNLIDNNFKTLKLDTQSLEIEKQRLIDLLKNKENELRLIKLEFSTLNENIKKIQQGDKLEELLSEISTKNQTINYLIDEVEKVKKESRDKLIHNEKIIIEFQDENENLNLSLNQLREEFDNFKLNNNSQIKDLKKENEILLNDLEEKENIIDHLSNQKIQIENEFEDKFKNNEEYNEKIVNEIKVFKEENDILREELEKVTKSSIERFNKLNEKLNKSQKKIDNLINVYECHIKFLKERFDSILNDFKFGINMKINNKDFSDKFLKIVKNIESQIENINHLAEREALCENLKSEVKSCKNNVQILNEKNKKLLKENEDLNSVVNIKKLQMKTSSNVNNNYKRENDIVHLIHIENVMGELSNIKIKENNMRVNLQSATAENKIFNERISFLKENNENLNQKVESLEEEINKKEKDYTEINKSHKNEIVRIMDEIKRIKEKWLPPEKQNEFISTIEELEKQIKNLKDDNNRKRELIVTLKGQISELKDLNNSNNLNKETNNFQSGFSEEKMKNLNKEMTRKEILLKELRNNLELIKSNEKKLLDENSNLIEKNKINKIDITRKENIIKELRDKMKEYSNNLNNEQNLNKTMEDIKENNKKVKIEIERKDGIIKTLKAKLESTNLEIEQLRSLNLKLSKNNYNEVEKEQKQQEMIRNKLDGLSQQNENLLSVTRRIFKDLIQKYEKLKSKSNIFDRKGLKEGLDILGVTQDELDDYINPNDKMEIYDRINNLLEMEIIDAETLMNIYNTLKEKIRNLEKAINNENNADNIFKKYI